MHNSGLIFTAFLVLAGVLIFGFWSNIHTYAQQPSSSAQSTTQMSSVPKIKITSPTKGQQVPVGKDLTISGTSMDNATSNCQVAVIVNNVKPYQNATDAGTGGAADFSKWNFVLMSKYTTIKLGQNKITARYECVDNPASKGFSSINITGIQGTATAAAAAATAKPKTSSLSATSKQQVVTTTTTTNPISHSTQYVTWTTIDSLSDLSNTSSSSSPTIAPQVSAISEKQQQPAMAGVNSTSGQNYTFATISPTFDSGKLMYLGYHGDSGSSSSDSKPSTSHHSTGRSSTDSSSTEGKKKTDSSSTKSDNTSTTTNVDSSSDAKSGSNSDTKSSSPTNHSTRSSSDLGSAIRNKVDSIVKNSLRSISHNVPFLLPFH
jgi:hypothetical protein